MNTRKVVHAETKGKSAGSEDYQHYMALEWSEGIMVLARTTNPRRAPQAFERSSDIKELRQYFLSLKGRKILTFEETTSAQWLYLELCDVVDRIIICDPHYNRLLIHGPKTDKIDATKLCTLLCAGLLKEVFHSASELYELRRLVSGYDDLVQGGVRLLNQHHALERAGGPTHRAGRFAPFVADYLQQSIALYQKVKPEYEKKFDHLCRHHRLLRNLKQLDGIGTIGAVKILAVVVDAHRFPSAGHYVSYCGLVKHQKYSGGHYYGQRQGQYNRILKAVYKTATLAAIKGQNPIREYYDYLLSKGVAEHNARNAVARYLAKVTYGMLKSGEAYQPYRWRDQGRHTANT
jgi:transposase